MNVVKKLANTGVIAAALAELQKDKVKEATGRLKTLYKQRDSARKVLRNVDREIDDYLQELEINDDDTNGEDT